MSGSREKDSQKRREREPVSRESEGGGESVGWPVANILWLWHDNVKTKRVKRSVLSIVAVVVVVVVVMLCHHHHR